MNEKSPAKLKVMVSSTVYGIEELLDRVYSLLTSFGYEVWMSHKGTLPVSSDKTAFENCLCAVEKCDLFLGIITTSYGSGQDPDNPSGESITHKEILKAIELKKLRWLLAHEHVVFARTLLNNLGYKGIKGRKKLKLEENLRNSGALPEGVTVESLRKGQISVLRNPDIAHVLYLRGLMERIGRGSVMMVNKCREQNLPPPKWESNPDSGVTVTFYTTEATTEVATEATTEVKRLLSKLQGEMSRSEIRDLLGLKNDEHLRKAYLTPALKLGLIERTIPDKPKSPKQKYRLSAVGKRLSEEDV